MKRTVVFDQKVWATLGGGFVALFGIIIAKQFGFDVSEQTQELVKSNLADQADALLTLIIAVGVGYLKKEPLVQEALKLFQTKKEKE
jgi:hypothetical protein